MSGLKCIESIIYTYISFFKRLMTYLTLFYVHWCDGVRSCGTAFSDNCELPCGCWELNPGSLEEQSVLLTAEPSLQPLYLYF